MSQYNKVALNKKRLDNLNLHNVNKEKIDWKHQDLFTCTYKPIPKDQFLDSAVLPRYSTHNTNSSNKSNKKVKMFTFNEND